jgi:hypothetical protein
MKWLDSDPVFWSGRILIALAAGCLLPSVAFAFVGWNVAAAVLPPAVRPGFATLFEIGLVRKIAG